jgi:hypothetical protein
LQNIGFDILIWAQSKFGGFSSQLPIFFSNLANHGKCFFGVFLL